MNILYMGKICILNFCFVSFLCRYCVMDIYFNLSHHGEVDGEEDE